MPRSERCLRSPVACVASLLFLLCAGCGDEEGPTSASRHADQALRLARARAAAHFASEAFREAEKAIAPLLAQDPVPAEDHVRAGIVADALGTPDAFEKARAHFEKALALDPDNAEAHYCLGVLLQRGEEAKALEHMRRARELAPGDYPTALQLGQLLGMLDQPDEAAAIYERLEKIGVEQAGNWHLVTIYNLAQVRMRQGRRDDAMALLDDYKRLQARGLSAPGADAVRRGNLGRLRVPAPEGAPRPQPIPPAWTLGDRIGSLTGMTSVVARTLVDDWAHVEDTCVVAPPDLIAWGPGGLQVLRHGASGYGDPEIVETGPVTLLATADLDRDGTLDLTYATDAGVRIRLGTADGWRAPAFAVPALPGVPSDIAPVDADHDGDLDLLLVGPFGARLWRNDGVAEGGALADAGSDAGLTETGPLAWCLVEDLDTDQDVDFLLGGPGVPTRIADSLRGGRFRLIDAGLGASATRPAVADFDADGRPDLVCCRGPRRRLDGASLQGLGPPVALASPLAGMRAFDLDLDGVADVVDARAEGSVRGVLAPAASEPQVFQAPLPEGAQGAGTLEAADTEGKRRYDLLAPTPAGVLRLNASAKPGNAFLLALRGTKDNRRGVGAIVEILAGAHYQRIFWTGEPTLIGLGQEAKVDVTRITWPNGVIQYDLDTEAGCARLIEQAEGLVGSCPFLYAWNGERYVFISDVLGITPLGLPMAPGMFVPDHDEYVLVTGEQLAPRTLEDGSPVYELQVTEELREVTYLDRAKLLVVDHPADTVVQPNERFSFPPFPEPHVHVVRPFPAKRAIGSDGTDWTRALERDDGDYAAPFEPYKGQLLGLAPRHHVELHFDPARIPATGRLRLLLTGWFYWTDASVNMAVARTPGIAFEPPILFVPHAEDATNGSGGASWRAAGPPVGFPAGKRKTMVLDVSDVIDREDPRLRIVTTLRLYWDAIQLAVGDDAPSRTHEIEPNAAMLWERGFSKPIPTFGEHALDWFEWGTLDAPRWNPHPGLYTRLGEVEPLLTAVDDRFVIMASGDALRLRFPADGVPALPKGWRRDYLLFLDGWAKDRDPNTRDAEFVEPLPFHAMSGYPYKPNERYPDGPVHRAYRDEWNTRIARQWIRPLRPPAPAPTMR